MHCRLIMISMRGLLFYICFPFYLHFMFTQLGSQTQKYRYVPKTKCMWMWTKAESKKKNYQIFFRCSCSLSLFLSNAFAFVRNLKLKLCRQKQPALSAKHEKHFFTPKQNNYICDGQKCRDYEKNKIKLTKVKYLL